MSHIHDIEAHRDGRDVYLAFNKYIGLAIRRAFDEDPDDAGIHLVKGASIVRKYMLNMTNKFERSFKEGCQESSIPEPLLA